MSYKKYVAWRRLTHGGKRGRDQMTPDQRAKFDALGISEAPAADAEAARRAYLAMTAPFRPPP